ncbi:hypothetical protein V8C43DRAFT_318550 [Trichoderma afarasin]
MAFINDSNTADFRLLYKTEQGIWIATKRNEYGSLKYIAQPLGILDGIGQEDTEDAKSHQLMYNSNLGVAIAQIFNHENIVSIAGHIRTHPIISDASAADEPQPGRPRDYIVWDYCDAGNLSGLFLCMPRNKSRDFYLPESLCWHVLTSLLNAITYLHDGKRLFLDTKAPAGEERQWLPLDQDWNPILHRAIEPRNIFFQHPRGSETYGLCKLGNFEDAVVTNHVITPGDGPDTVDEDVEISIAMAARRGFESLETLRHKLRTRVTANTADNYPYTIANELFSVGKVISTMMTGEESPSYDKLPMTRYSAGLRRVVMDLVDLQSNSKRNITNVLPRTKMVMGPLRSDRLTSALPQLLFLPTSGRHFFRAGVSRNSNFTRVTQKLSRERQKKKEALRRCAPTGPGRAKGPEQASERARANGSKFTKTTAIEKSPTVAMSVPTATPPLLLTKRLNTFLHSHQTAHLPTLLLTTSQGKLLAHASSQPVSVLRTHATVAASLLAIHTSSSAAIPTALPGSRTPDPMSSSPGSPHGSDDNHHLSHDEDEDADGPHATESARSKQRPRRTIRPVTITVQLSEGTVIIRRLKCGLLFVCVGPAAYSLQDLHHTSSHAHHENGDGVGSPSEVESLISAGGMTTSSLESASAPPVVAMRRQAAELARWLDEKLGTLRVPEEGIGVVEL